MVSAGVVVVVVDNGTSYKLHLEQLWLLSKRRETLQTTKEVKKKGVKRKEANKAVSGGRNGHVSAREMSLHSCSFVFARAVQPSIPNYTRLDTTGITKTR